MTCWAEASASRTNPHASTVTRRHLLALGALLPAAALLGCSAPNNDGSPGGRRGAAFDFTESTPAGEVIPAAQRQSAPAFSGELLDGHSFRSTALKGDLAVINFWGSWCAPCRLETPDFQAVYTDVRGLGVQFLGVNVKDQRQLARAFVTSARVDYPSLYDPRGEIALAFRGFPANVVPTTIVLDRAGLVAAVDVRAMRGEDLRRCLDQLLSEVGAE